MISYRDRGKLYRSRMITPALWVKHEPLLKRPFRWSYHRPVLELRWRYPWESERKSWILTSKATAALVRSATHARTAFRWIDFGRGA